MWDRMAEIFGEADLRTMEQPVIIAVNSCRVSKNRGTTCIIWNHFFNNWINLILILLTETFTDYQLTATSATWFYLNPKIPEADQAREQ